MGIAIDSSVLISAERQRMPVSLLLRSLQSTYDETQFMISAVTVMELEHGCHRAHPGEAALRRRRYVDEVFEAIPIEPFTRGMGVLAGEIDAELRKAGFVIASADLMIGATALFHRYAIGTQNLRHFRMIPRLKVLAL